MLDTGMAMSWLKWLGTWALMDFGLAMTMLALVFILFHIMVRIRYVSFYEIVYRWIALFALGFTCLYAAYMHVAYPDIAAAAIGWATSPFQFEVGMADLAIGLLGVFSFRASYGFRLATVIASMVFMWGDAVGHLNQMMINNNFTPGNAGSWFWLDLLIPLVLIFCIAKMKTREQYA